LPALLPFAVEVAIFGAPQFLLQAEMIAIGWCRRPALRCHRLTWSGSEERKPVVAC
jgi:hypothetical protein